MAVCTDRTIVYHIPKCGGIWVKEALRAAGLDYGRARNRKEPQAFGLRREHATPGIVTDGCQAGRFSVAFVRHPVGWYRSFWCYRVKTGHLDMKFPPDRVWSDVFEEFVGNVLAAWPSGFVTALYQYYVGPGGDGLDFVGRQERLAADLVQALTLAGETFDEAALRGTRRRNVSASKRRFRDMCALSDGTRDRLLEAEQWVVDTFYA